MAFEEVGKKRYKLEESSSGTVITIPSKKNWFMIVFLGFWLIGWAVGEITVIGILSAGIFKLTSNGLSEITKSGPGAIGGLFLMAWLGGWTVGGIFAIYVWLWQVRGIERISLSYEALVLEKITPIWKRKKEYHLRDVVSLRQSNMSSSMWTMSGGMEFWGISGGRLAFDYGAKTVRFGIGLDEVETKFLIKDIEKKNPEIIEKIN